MSWLVFQWDIQEPLFPIAIFVELRNLEGFAFEVIAYFVLANLEGPTVVASVLFDPFLGLAVFTHDDASTSLLQGSYGMLAEATVNLFFGHWFL